MWPHIHVYVPYFKNWSSNSWSRFSQFATCDIIFFSFFSNNANTHQRPFNNNRNPFTKSFLSNWLAISMSNVLCWPRPIKLRESERQEKQRRKERDPKTSQMFLESAWWNSGIVPVVWGNLTLDNGRSCRRSRSSSTCWWTCLPSLWQCPTILKRKKKRKKKKEERGKKKKEERRGKKRKEETRRIKKRSNERHNHTRNKATDLTTVANVRREASDLTLAGFFLPFCQ